MDETWKAFLAKYDRVYNPEANERALQEKAEVQQRKVARTVSPRR